MKYLTLPVVTLIIGFCMTSFASAGCGFNNQGIDSQHSGFNFYRGLLVQRDRKTGKKLGAFKGVSANGYGGCIRHCIAERGCRGVTIRSTRPRNCLLFAGYDFETKRPMVLTIYNGGGSARSAIVRKRFMGPLCN